MTKFDEEFQTRVKRVETQGLQVGLNWTTICKQAGVSRATPDRWRKQVPKTVEVLTKMESIVAQKQAEIAKSAGLTQA